MSTTFPTTYERIAAMRPGPTVARSLMLGLAEDLSEFLCFENTILKPEFQNQKSGRRSIAELNKILNKENNKVSQKQEKLSDSEEKERRVHLYMEQFERNLASGSEDSFEIDFEPMVTGKLKLDKLAAKMA